jgi:hypothetical protein
MLVEIKPKETFKLELPLDKMFATGTPCANEVNVRQIISLGGEKIATVAPTLTPILVE